MDFSLERIATQDALATPDRFRAWLDSKPEGACVGYGGQADNCPLAKFLSDTRLARFQVGHYVVVALAPAPERVLFTVDLPRWAVSFASGVDVERPSTISKATALAILDRAIAWAGRS